MTSTYSTRLRFEQQAAGDNLNTWGPKINAALLRLEESIAGRQAISTYPITLTTANGTTDQAREMFLDCSGAGGTITIPAVEKLYFVRNNSSATITITTGSGTTATVLPTEVKAVLCDATNCYAEFITGNYLPLAGGTLTGGLTGTTATFSGTVVGATTGDFGTTATNPGLRTRQTVAGTSAVLQFTDYAASVERARITADTSSNMVLTAAGTTTITNNATIGGTLGVTGATTLTGALSPNGGIVMLSNMTGGTTAGAYTLAGGSTFQNGGSIQLYGSAASGAPGTIQFAGGTGGTNTSFGSFNASGLFNVVNNATIGGTLGVTGALTAGSFAGTALANAAQTLTGSSTTQAITPSGFAGNSSIGTSGYYKLPGGLIIAWGTITTSASASVTLTLPTTFSGSNNYTITFSHDGSTTASGWASLTSGTRTTTTVGVDGWQTTSVRAALTYDYHVIGY